MAWWRVRFGGCQGRKNGATMDYDELNDVVKRQPFMPVQVHLSNGATYEVTHPDSILVRKRVAAIAVGDSIHLVSMLHINQVVPMVPTQ